MKGMRYGLGFILLTSFVVVGVWRFSEPATPITLAAGFECVEREDEECFEKIKTEMVRSGRNDEAIILQCAWLAEMGHHSEIVKELPERLIEGPLRREALRLLGEAWFRVGDLNRAEELLKKMREEFPDDAETYRNLAMIYYSAAENKLARKAQAELRRVAPDDFRPHHLSALLAMEDGNLKEAIEEFQLALKKQPPHRFASEIRISLAKCLIQTRQYQEAIAAIEREQGSTAALGMRAACYWHLNDKERARVAARELLTLEKKNVWALSVKASLQDEDGKSQAAIKTLKEILSVDKVNQDARKRLIHLLIEQGMTEESEAEQREFENVQKLKDRLVELRAQQADKPDDVFLRDELATVCDALGLTEKAAAWRYSIHFLERQNALRSAVGQPFPDRSPATSGP